MLCQFEWCKHETHHPLLSYIMVGFRSAWSVVLQKLKVVGVLYNLICLIFFFFNKLIFLIFYECILYISLLLCVFVFMIISWNLFQLFFVDNNSSFSFPFLSIVFTYTMYGEFSVSVDRFWSPPVCSVSMYYYVEPLSA